MSATMPAPRGLVALNRLKSVAFGPYLGFAMWLTLLYGPFS